MMACHKAVRLLPRVLHHAAAKECACAGACSSSAASTQHGTSRPAADAGSSRSCSTEAQPAEQPRTASGLNMVKGGTDPQLLPDSEYPAWLWQLGDTRPPLSQLRRAKEGELTFEHTQRQLKLENRELIRERNATKAKKQ